MPRPFPEARRHTAEYRTRLAQLGFHDDGETLQGPVKWSDAVGAMHQERVEITFDGGFPYTPPQVRPIAATSPGSLHQERTGHLCMFDRGEPAGVTAPWRDPEGLLERVASWFEQSDAGWPGDEDVDLERYLPSTDGLVLYNGDGVGDKNGYLHLSQGRAADAFTRVDWQAPPPNRASRLLRSKEPYGWLADVGEITQPILTWLDVATLLGDEENTRTRNISSAGLRLLLLRYSRSGNIGYLALHVAPNAEAPGGIEILAIEAADESESVLNLRAGDQASLLRNLPVAIIGCGAVGSHVADLLLRAGVRRLQLMDRHLLRPGNCVRHLAGPEYIGQEKSHATAACLARSGPDSSEVETVIQRIGTLSDAQEVFSQVQLVIDATADSRATQLLAAAAQSSGKTLLSVALMRQGGIAVVDRIGHPEHGAPLPTPPELPGAPADLRERGCGDTVSRTPPHSVVAAAALVTRLAIDELAGVPVPTSTFEVLEPQPDAPYDERKVFMS